MWAAIKSHEESLATSGELARRRRERLDREFRRVLVAKVEAEVGRVSGLEQNAALVRSVMSHTTDPYEAAEILIAQVGSAARGEDA
jgi:putative protein kinase ArgK-like GTPase of G3E family